MSRYHQERIERSMANKFCYACDAAATSDEHVPPKCFFPKERRKNLVKVRSCEEHNQRKSSEDTYALWQTAFQLGCSNVAGELLETMKRAAERDATVRDGRFMKRLASEHARSGIEGVSISDTTRLRNFHGLVAKGIYRFTTGDSLRDSLLIANHSWHPDSVDAKQKATKRRQLFENLLDGIPEEGENPEVFRFRILAKNGSTLIETVFFDYVRHWAATPSALPFQINPNTTLV